MQPLYTCICKTLSLSFTRSNAEYVRGKTFIHSKDVFHENSNYPDVYNLAPGHAGETEYLVVRSIVIPSRKYDAWWKSILYDYSSDRVSIDSRPDSPGFVSNYRRVGPRGLVVSNNHGFCG